MRRRVTRCTYTAATTAPAWERSRSFRQHYKSDEASCVVVISRISHLTFFVLLLAALLVGFSECRMPASPLSAAGLTNLGRSCYNVLDFGADPTGASDSTPAFQAALQSASMTNGVAVCAPAGLYWVTHLTLFSGASGSG